MLTFYNLFFGSSGRAQRNLSNDF